MSGGPSMRTCAASGAIVCATLAREQLAQVGALPGLRDEQVVGGGHGAQPRREVGDEAVHVVREARGLARHRLDDGEEVLRAVGQLAHHQPHLLLVAPPLGQVERGADHARRPRRPRRSSARAAGRRSAARRRSRPRPPASRAGRSSSTRCLAGTSLRSSGSGKISASVRPRKSSAVGARRGVVHEGVAQVGVLLEDGDRRVLQRQLEAAVGGGELRRHRGEAHLEEPLLGHVDRGAEHAVDLAVTGRGSG